MEGVSYPQPDRREAKNAQRKTATEAPVTSSSTPGLARFNTLADDEATTALHEVCASAAWGRAILSRRPYATTEALLLASDAATAALPPKELADAMAGHPPIGRPKPGDPASSREQRGMAGATEELKAEMLELNLAYQKRFGHVFLICATGATGEQMRDAVKSRIGNSPEQERGIVRTELGKINRIRLTRLATEGE
ncbi:2-oxo-4-hydroxy-4-carboxy-5-ureidoimidazoline decarboxylase [Streptomyces gelaticus]|uniref:2-oxo-4-hydroxy-4-carboxy-5-ureidoimidazoline decarboxylase n=1 Tax=Streptomyces gelaticus TaxID=285446 RepID=A0ABQ2VX13_9ACTN|nr:2-oxo-4-hydroxy-4-carboxy-5-ureidoimidazoline decarboxylase [Streptomyces gelaticus]